MQMHDIRGKVIDHRGDRITVQIQAPIAAALPPRIGLELSPMTTLRQPDAGRAPIGSIGTQDDAHSDRS